MNYVTLINQAFQFVIQTSQEYCIDESHALKHSMEVFNFANNIYESEIKSYPHITDQREIIGLAAIVHDMCDKKYMNEAEGLAEINAFLSCKITDAENAAIASIITTMSYSKVKKDGFPDLGIYQRAYHVVREADLLTAYDFDRCMIYHMKVNHGNFKDSFYKAAELFEHRVFRHADDNLFTTNYALTHYPPLHNQALERIKTWKKILHI